MTGRHQAEDVEARAARLGITEDHILTECRAIAFSDICRIVEWDDDGKLKPKTINQIGEDSPAIAEIVASASSGIIYRVKMHDKKPVLELLMRCLRMLPSKAPNEENRPADDEDPRERFIAAIDRLAAKGPPGCGDPQPRT